MENYEAFKKIMQEYNTVLDRLLVLENSKTGIIASGKTSDLDDCMRKEEAEMLRMKGLDRKREKLLKENGLEGKTFREIVDLQAAAQKSELQPLCNQMQEKTERMQKLSASIASMMEARLVSIDRAIAGSMGEGNAYSRDGKRKDTEAAPRMRPTSV